MLNETEVIAKFSQIIPQLPEQAFGHQSPPHPGLLLNADGPFEVFYAPLDWAAVRTQPPLKENAHA
jgi:hypothetical protein